MGRPSLAPAREAGPCPICGVVACKVIHSRQVPFGVPLEPPARTYTVPEQVWRDELLAYAAGEVIDYELAVQEGFVERTELPEPPAKGNRPGEPRHRPSLDRMRRLAEDRRRKKEQDR